MPARPPAFRPQVESLEAREVPAFGVGGLVTADVGFTQGDAVHVAVLPDGKIISAGHNSVARFNADGSPDLTFNGTGYRLTRGYVTSMAVMADGRVVVGGSGRVNNQEDFYLERFNTNGTPDNTFDGDGLVLVGFKSKGQPIDDRIHGLAIQADGKIVAVGGINGLGLWGVARFNTNGSLDTSFSGDGWLTDEFDKKQSLEFATSVVIQGDGKILVQGTAYRAATGQDLVVVRYTTNGNLDSTFGTGGKAWVDFGVEAGLSYTSERPYGGEMALDGSGKIVVSVRSQGWPYASIGVARLTPSGALDTSFSGNGLLLAAPPGYPDVWNDSHGLTVQSDGTILLTLTASSVRQPDGSTTGGAFVGRINADGTADATFDEDGWLMFQFAPGMSTSGNSLVVQPDGKILVAGVAGDTQPLLGLARFNADGSLDV